MSFSLSLGPFHVNFRHKDSAPKPLIDEAKVRRSFGEYDYSKDVVDHPNHARLAQISQTYGDEAARLAAEAAAKAAATKEAQIKRADEILHVLNDSDAVDLMDIHTNQLKAEGRHGYFSNAIRLGRDMLNESAYVKGDLYLYVEDEHHAKDFHFQDDSRVCIGVRDFWSKGLRQLHTTETLDVDPVKLRAVIDAIADRAMEKGAIAKEDRHAI